MSDYEPTQNKPSAQPPVRENKAPVREPDPLDIWWQETSEADLAKCLPKLHEYGSYDLIAVGDMIAHVAGWSDATDAEKAELGCWFYELGKVSRAFDAIKQHRLPSDDTVLDVSIYAMMIRRIRNAGGWK